MSYRILAGIIIFLIFTIGGVFLLKTKKIPSMKLKPEEINNIVDANNQFAIDYYSRLKSTNNDNIFFSPFSISSVLAMVYEGAKGQTAKEIRSVFYFQTNDELRRGEYTAMFNRLDDKDKSYKLEIANALWAQKDYQFLTEYFNTIKKYYDGEVNSLDFKEHSRESRLIINNWIEDQTNGKIKNLIPEGLISPSTRLILTDAIYFKGRWAEQFNKRDTKYADFKIDNNNIVKVLMMQRIDEEAVFNYAESKKLQILEMPYSGEELSMLIFLPKNNNLRTIENLLSIRKLLEWKKKMRKQKVKVFIPKFKIKTKYFMANDLEAMGMPTAFKFSEADFSGMDGTKNLYISEIIHQAFVEVNESGTEAAAVTAAIGLGATRGGKAAKIPIFCADHPFIFLIQERKTGIILFMGRVINPTL